MSEFAPRPETGRVFANSRRVYLGDVGSDGVARPDALARMLQDVAGDDWDDAAGPDEDVWVVRRTSVALTSDGRWPRLGESVELATWCAGSGAAWAERRTDVSVDAQLLVRARAIWVPVDRTTGLPRRLRDSFFAIYGEAARRRVSSRVELSEPPSHALRRPWALRRADLDVVGHVNNAAVWEALSEVAPSGVRAASVVHHASLESDDAVTLATAPGRLWLLVDGAVRVAGDFEV